MAALTGLLLLALVIVLLVLFLPRGGKPLPDFNRAIYRPEKYDRLALRKSELLEIIPEYFEKDIPIGRREYPFLIHAWPRDKWQSLEEEETLREIEDGTKLYEAFPERFARPSVTADDQLQYLLYLAETQNHGEFKKRLKYFEKGFVTEEGWILARAMNGNVLQQGPPDWQQRMTYLKALLLAYRDKPRRAYDKRIEEQAMILRQELEDEKLDAVKITTEKIIYPMQGSVEPVLPESEEANIQTLAGIPLGEIDLWVLKALAAWDKEYGPLYQKWLGIVKGAALEEGFYHAYWNPESETYILSEGRFNVSSEASLKILNHLQEVGEAPQEAYEQWVIRYYTTNDLKPFYHVVTGEALSLQSDLVALAALKSLALSYDNELLYTDLQDRFVFLKDGGQFSSGLYPVQEGDLTLYRAGDQITILRVGE